MKRLVTVRAETERDTERLGRALGTVLQAGDAVLLSAPLGTGKTVLARGVVRALSGEDLPVPSPSYALVQEYKTNPPLHHVDLFRIEDPTELTELGLTDATEEGILLIEWPEHAGETQPHDPLILEGQLEGTVRRWTMSGSERWGRRLAAMEALS